MLVEALYHGLLDGRGLSWLTMWGDLNIYGFSLRGFGLCDNTSLREARVRCAHPWMKRRNDVDGSEAIGAQFHVYKGSSSCQGDAKVQCLD